MAAERKREQEEPALIRALLACAALVVLTITWAPFRVVWPERLDLLYYSSFRDILVNLVLFLPLGFLVAASVARSWARRPSWARSLAAMGFGLGFSVLIEAGQVFIEGRYTTLYDVGTNMVGAWMGAEVYRRLASGIGKHASRRLIMALAPATALGLLTGLFVMQGFASVARGPRAIVPVLIGLSWGPIFAALWRIGVPRRAPAPAIVAVSAAWFALGSLPTLREVLWTVPVGTVLTAAATWVTLRGGRAVEGAAPAIVRRAFGVALVFLVPALLLLHLWPPVFRGGSWEWHVGLIGFGEHANLSEVHRLMQLVVAFAAVGFLLAGARQRRSDGSSLSLLVPLAAAFAVALLLEGARGFHQVLFFSPVHLFLTLVSAATGVLLFRLEQLRDHDTHEH